MRKTLAALALLACTAVFGQERLTGYVNPFIGTDGFGNVYPGAQIPFGGIQISPDTDDFDYDVAAGYKYNKPTILGFSLTHLSGTGIPDLGDFLFVPGTGTLKSATGTEEDPDSGYRSRYYRSAVESCFRLQAKFSLVPWIVANGRNQEGHMEIHGSFVGFGFF